MTDPALRIAHFDDGSASSRESGASAGLRVLPSIVVHEDYGSTRSICGELDSSSAPTLSLGWSRYFEPNCSVKVADNHQYFGRYRVLEVQSQQ